MFPPAFFFLFSVSRVTTTHLDLHLKHKTCSCSVTVTCHAIPASGRLVDVDILELSEFPRPGVGICHTSMGPGWLVYGEGIRPETDTLGMAERW